MRIEHTVPLIDALLLLLAVSSFTLARVDLRDSRLGVGSTRRVRFRFRRIHVKHLLEVG